jgi:hypothetical protein
MSLVFAVTGGRNYRNVKAVDTALRKWVRPGDPTAVVIEGGATGADRLVREWCAHNGVHYATVPALWDWSGNSAGPKRNAAMLLLRPEFLLAFPGGRGTRDMCYQAQAAGIRVEHAS